MPGECFVFAIFIRAAPSSDPAPQGDKALLYEIFCCQTPMALGATHGHENRWPPRGRSKNCLEFYLRGKERSRGAEETKFFQSRHQHTLRTGARSACYLLKL